ncbi:DUF3021 domain-containing protein [Cellulosilyticum lentocellum]|uniref:DUF3021 domain-containing protein n=1 Tax=Cellulosilyticum lentocellum (strain ATCC 49066 / DSM 5427 / NCIMB 11756 / RHM5) TaxID=642492 RepID=F2JNJ1_CELLD|nr:DUF3021 domain-containing protein [Cellulosilyticum lentocellum]ADZ84767.1 Protein of unknown function DUF3021 [Cellulosilyticum lentocellum DSM 5427]
MKEEIRRIMNQFFIITTGTVGGATLFTAFFYNEGDISQSILWQILVLSFLTACMNIIFHSAKELTKKQMIFRQGVHFIVVFIILMVGGLSFEWVEGKDIKQIITFSLIIVAVYVFVCTIVYLNDRKTTDRLNEKLKVYRDKKQQEE